MDLVRRIIWAGSYRLALKATKAVPLIGTALAVGLIGYEIKKKGIARGLLNTALDATPVVGLVKNSIEIFTGDWLADKRQEKSGVRSPESGVGVQSPESRSEVHFRFKESDSGLRTPDSGLFRKRKPH